MAIPLRAGSAGSPWGGGSNWSSATGVKKYSAKERREMYKTGNFMRAQSDANTQHGYVLIEKPHSRFSQSSSEIVRFVSPMNEYNKYKKYLKGRK
nr:MAG TPA: hypothetical protein [Caudoviricetes sp.]